MSLTYYYIMGKGGGGASTYFYDLFPTLTRAFSTRQLSDNTNAFNLQKGATTDYLDIGYSSGNIDTSGYSAFLGANNGFVRKYYDATNEAREFTGSNVLTYDGTAPYEDANGNLAYRFLSSWMDVPFTSTISGAFSFLFYGQFKANTGAYPVITDTYNISGRNGFSLYRAKLAPSASDSLSFYSYNGSGYTLLAHFAVNTDIALWEISRGTDNKIHLYKNGVLQASSALTTTLSFNPLAKMRVGAANNGTAASPMDVPEFLFFNSDISADRAAITDNILTAFL
jgi:hypothetical protein